MRQALDRVAVATVRERKAQKTLEDFGVHRCVFVTADPALLLKPEPFTTKMLQHEGINRERALSACRHASRGWRRPTST